MTRNLVLICLDSVRKDYFDDYASRLRARADVSFEQCRAASGWSVPSHASMVTGELPHQHGIHVYDRDFSGLTRADTFLGDIPDHRAVGASANAYASSAFGFDGFFDDYTDVSPHRRFPEGLDVMRFGQEHDRDGLSKYAHFVRTALAHDHPMYSLANGAFVQINDALAAAPVPKLFDDGATIVAREALRDVREGVEPFFCFTNFMDAHGPHCHVRGYDRDLHDAPNTWTSGAFGSHAVNVADDLDPYEEDLEHNRGLYAASIDYLDRRVAAFVDDVQAATDRETTFVITADHGENLALDADDGLVAHKGALTEGLLHVPLEVVNPPEGTDYPETVEGYVSHLRLGDLLVGLARGETPDVTADRVPAERVGSNLPDRIDRDGEEGRYWDRMIRCVYENGEKLAWDSLGGRERYHLDHLRPCWQDRVATGDDAGVPVADLDAALFDEPTLAYKRAALEAETEVAVDAATERRLEDLGYL